MKFDREWTAFALEAEFDAHGMMRIAEAHNSLRAALEDYAQHLKECNIDPRRVHWWRPIEPQDKCDCGLDAALKGGE